MIKITICIALILSFLIALSLPKTVNAQISQIWETIVGNPSDNSDPAPDDNEGDKTYGPVPSCGEIEASLKNDFGVTVQSGGYRSFCGDYVNGPAQSVNCEMRQGIWKALSVPAKSSGFRARLKKYKPWKVQCFVHPKGPLFTNGCVSSADVVNIGNCDFIGEHPNEGYRHMLHEVSHLLKNRNYRDFYSNFPLSTLANSDPSCYDGLFVKTYSIRTSDARSESMAEASMLYVYNNKTNFSTKLTISNFKNQCNNSYRWAGNNIYNNYGF